MAQHAGPIGPPVSPGGTPHHGHTTVGWILITTVAAVTIVVVMTLLTTFLAPEPGPGRGPAVQRTAVDSASFVVLTPAPAPVPAPRVPER
ncbi:hypothetical protein [Terrabacter sp. MAHUQ-38]|uniref:hypothetical protein n=1 Tax=unclassified Terrabacter TaxID=2630222 RepID=UPI00165E845B|nr:hypothetical protein [Terrabacter sp. MAHUQ-38]MBC9822769.1 hypothetical protein [Terrabacter sp. MAHUQ-38]